MKASILVGVLENKIIGIGFERAGFEPAGTTELAISAKNGRGNRFPLEDDLDVTDPPARGVKIDPSGQLTMILFPWQKAFHAGEIHRAKANPEFELMVPHASTDEDVLSQSRR